MIRILRTIEEMESLSPAWLALWEKDPLCTAFSHPAWYISYVRTHPDSQIVVVVWEEGDRLNLVWPLQRKGKTLTFLSDPRPDYSRPAVDPELDAQKAAEALLEAYEREFKGLPLALRDFCPDDPLPAAIAGEAVRRGCFPILAEGHPSARLSLRADADAANLDILKSTTLRQSASKLNKMGAVFERLQDWQAVEANLPGFFALHTARWAGLGETLFLEPRVRAFYREVLRQLPAEMVAVFRLRLDDTLLAMDVDFVSKGTYFYYKPVFSPAFAKLSPGLALLRHIVSCMAGSLHTLDFGRGLESYKKRFAMEVRRNQTLIVCPSLLSKIAWQAGAGLRERFGRGTKVGGAIRRLLNKAGAVHAKYGLAGALRQAGRKAWRACFTSPTLLMFETASGSPDEPSLPAGLSLREGGLPDLFDAADLVNPVDKAEYIARMLERLKAGDRVYLAAWDGALVHSSWISRQDPVRLGEIDRDYPLGPGAAYIFDCFTLPAARGRGIYPAVLARLTWQFLQPMRTSRVLISCLSDNAASVHGIQKAGFALKEKLARR